MKREEFMRQAIASGKSKDEVKRIYDAIEADNGFETEETEQSPPEEKIPTGRNLFSLPDNVEKAIFPTSGTQATGERAKGLEGSLKQGAMAGLDALSLPTRVLGTLAGYDISDPKSAVLRPAIEWTNKKIDKLPAPKKGMTLPMVGNPMGATIPAADYRVPLKGTSEFIGTTLSDPTLYLGLLKRLIAKPLQGTATKIESSVLGKGNKKLLGKQGLTSEQAAKNALEENVGGNLKGTVKKVNKKAVKLDDKIDQIISDYEAANPGATLSPDDAVMRVRDRITRPGSDPLVFGKTPEVKKAVDFWTDEMARHNKLGPKKLSEYQNIKRDLGGVSFKGGQLSPDIDAKEIVSDLINLEMRDDIAKTVPTIKPLNEEFKKILPIKKLAQNRLPVDQSNNVLGLGTLLLSAGKLTPEQYGKIIAYELSRSGDVAQGLYNIGRNIKNANYLVPLSLESNALNAARKKYNVEDINERKNK